MTANYDAVAAGKGTFPALSFVTTTIKNLSIKSIKN